MISLPTGEYDLRATHAKFGPCTIKFVEGAEACAQMDDDLNKPAPAGLPFWNGPVWVKLADLTLTEN